MPVSNRSRDTVPSGALVPYWQSECGRATVYVGDNLDVLAGIPHGMFHAVVTDPPYGLEFMGKEWDAPWKSSGGVDAKQRRAAEIGDPVKAKYLRHNVEYIRDSLAYQHWFTARAEAILRVAKPGAHLLSFGGTRMWHRMACAIEDAGWEIRDTVAWVYASGFPKGNDISKRIDRLLGAELVVVGKCKSGMGAGQFTKESGQEGGYGFKTEYEVTAPATDAAKQWHGWNTALKPAFEPIIVARKPPVGSVAENVLEHGCGGINVDGCRVRTTGEDVIHLIQSYSCYGSGIYRLNNGEAGLESMKGGFASQYKDGRWPANFVHDSSPEVIGTLPEGAARFFYSAKANSSDRTHMSNAEAAHPTVKPLDLMRYLVRLVCACGGAILDPFMGSGSTGVAAIDEEMYFVGVEQSEEYAKIAVDRLKVVLNEHPHLVKRLNTGKVVSVDATPPPPRRLR